MSVTPGQYFITLKNGGEKLSRYMVEDLSLMPKKVYLLPDAMPSTPLVIESSSGTFSIAQMGARYGKAHGDDVVALIIADMGMIGKFEFKSKDGGYIIGSEGRYIYKSNEQAMGGILAKFGDEGQASVFELHKVDY